MTEEMLGKVEDEHGLSEELQQRISSMAEKYSQLGDDEKAEFTRTMKGLFKDSVDKFNQGSVYNRLWGLSQSYAVLLLAIFIVIFIFVFFGYKLYKSLVERERKREEKRRNKQLKKKK